MAFFKPLLLMFHLFVLPFDVAIVAVVVVAVASEVVAGQSTKHNAHKLTVLYGELQNIYRRFARARAERLLLLLLLHIKMFLDKKFIKISTN